MNIGGSLPPDLSLVYSKAINVLHDRISKITINLCLVCWCTSANCQTPPDAPSTSTESVGYEWSFPALGTFVNFRAFHTDRELVEQVFKRGQSRILELEAILSDYNPESETRKLGERAVVAATPVSAELWEMLQASQQWHQKSEGAFDASLGTLTRLWRKHRRVHRVPPAEDLQAALERTGWEHVQLDQESLSVRLHKAGLQFDFGAIGKGYIVDEAFRVLQAGGLKCCLVNISGNIRCGPAPPEREGWRIEVAPLERGGQALRKLVLAECAVATSGDLWQYIEIDGQRRSHILDPRTGMGVLGPISATVIADRATDADAMATVACILPIADSLALADREQLEVLIARRLAELEVHATSGFPVGGK